MKQKLLLRAEKQKIQRRELLDIVDLIDKEGKKTFTGEAQAKAVYASLKEWGILDTIRAFVFDTTATVRMNFFLGQVIFFLAFGHHVKTFVSTVKAVSDH